MNILKLATILTLTAALGACSTMDRLANVGQAPALTAINDPTTAVLAIDQLHRLLRLVGQRSLANSTLSDDSGRPRVIFRTPDWEDFVHVTFREIRHQQGQY